MLFKASDNSIGTRSAKRALSLICCLSKASSNQIALKQQAGDIIIAAVKISIIQKKKNAKIDHFILRNIRTFK